MDMAQDGPKMAQDGPKTAPNCPRSPKMVQDRCKFDEDGPSSVDRGRMVEHVWGLEGCRARRWPQDGPKMFQNGPKMAQHGPKTAPRWAKTTPRWPKTAPRRPQDGPRRLILHSFFVPFVGRPHAATLGCGFHGRSSCSYGILLTRKSIKVTFRTTRKLQKTI